MGKFKVGDAVQLAWKPYSEYSPLVISSMFMHFVSGKRLTVIHEADKDGDYHLMDGDGKTLWLNENDIEAWDGESGDYHLMGSARKTLWSNEGDVEVCDEV